MSSQSWALSIYVCLHACLPGVLFFPIRICFHNSCMPSNVCGSGDFLPRGHYRINKILPRIRSWHFSFRTLFCAWVSELSFHELWNLTLAKRTTEPSNTDTCWSVYFYLLFMASCDLSTWFICLFPFRVVTVSSANKLHGWNKKLSAINPTANEKIWRNVRLCERMSVYHRENDQFMVRVCLRLKAIWCLSRFVCVE